ncbi:helicase HerA-like domain-containing protein [Rhodopseudomonas palustris]|uniref:helicase HerA-like domain-containing protein n=1 Tax=Rhodopseudomonas palustris TaxID=1076 RepID=UPI0009A4B814|nr:helicase HerA-like domain-containing protein [Rhodopseudomonas palustris]OPF97070.1 ATP-binding protein [Rhodopseudomonas palustris]
MLEEGKVYLGTGTKPEYLTLKLANRHGLITGATGTGKTVTLQVLAEGLSDAGVPVFCADVKGDLSGIGAPGEAKDFLEERARTIGFSEEYQLRAAPTVFWDLFGQKGHPVRTTVSEMGPLLLSRLLELNETQEGVLNIVFKVADDEGLLLLDLKDLRSLLVYVSENADAVATSYGNVAKATVGAIQRQLLVLEQQGGNHFFGEPGLQISDLMQVTGDGRGAVNVLAADKLMQTPRLYATFLLWLLSELFEELPEVGDLDKPKLVFFFDEAHLLFDEAPKALVDKVEQVVKLIRSKGVGIYFVTQNPLDIPESVLAQLGNRVQHALRAYTPREQKAVKVAAETFRPNPAFDTFTAITELGQGEALVSMLEGKAVPSIVERTLIRPPSSRLGPLKDEERAALMAASPLRGVYDEAVDRESAFEVLKARASGAQQRHDPVDPPRTKRESPGFSVPDFGWTRSRPSAPAPESGYDEPRRPRLDEYESSSERRRREEREERAARRDTYGYGGRQTVAEAAIKSVVRSVSSQVGSQIGRALVRGVLGSLLK